MNEKTENGVNNKVNEKVYLKQLGLKQEVISNDTLADKDLDTIANKTQRLDMDRINS